MTAADAARSGVAHVVAAAAAVLSFGKRLDRLALPQAGPVDKHQAALGGARRVILLQCHFSRVLPIRYRWRSEEHTSELQSLMRISYAVFCLKKKNRNKHTIKTLPKEQTTSLPSLS